MAGVGFNELVLLFIIGLLILGPERLPRVASQLGRWVGRARRTANQMRYQLEREIALNDIKKPPKPPQKPSAGSADDAAAGEPPPQARAGGQDAADGGGAASGPSEAAAESGDAVAAEPTIHSDAPGTRSDASEAAPAAAADEQSKR